MNNNQGNAPRRPISPQNSGRPQGQSGQTRPSAPAGQARPTGQRPSAARPAANGGQARQPQRPTSVPPQRQAPRPAPQRPAENKNSPQNQNRRPPMQTPYPRNRRGGLSNSALAIILAILSVILVALIITLVSVKGGCDTGKDNSPEETTPPSVDAGVTVPNESRPEWQPIIENTAAFRPVSNSSTVKLAANSIYSNNAIMVDRATGQVICEYGADTRIYPASMTKVMTVLVACDLIEDMNDTFTFTRELLYTIESGATNAYFIPDNPVPMVDLIYGAIIPSGADACLGLANALAGSEAEFVELMNKKASELGCTGTHFTNSIGLHNENHYSTVRDIATILNYAMENPFLRRVITASSYKTVAPVDRVDGTLYSTWQNNYNMSKATMIGAKSGYTPEAGRCLASVSKTIDGHEYVIVTAGAFFKNEISATNQSFADVEYLCNTYIK